MANFQIPDRLLVAIGGNAVHPETTSGTVAEQREYAERTAASLLPLMRLGNQLVVTHGNGPVVGKIMMRQAIARNRVTPMSLDICVAHSQGGVAYLLLQAMENALRTAGDPRHVVCLLTQVEVDPDDPAFDDPTKPIGYFYSEEEAKALARETGWEMREDSGRGWRHVVPSPRPRHIADLSLVHDLAARGAVVIAGGGGGIPVLRRPDGTRTGIEAVIDKDLTSAMMARALGIDTIMILTGIDRVAIDFGTPSQRSLECATLTEIKAHRDDGQFPPGSMGPKIDAAIDFIERGGKRVVIGPLERAADALDGRTGTHIVRDG